MFNIQSIYFRFAYIEFADKDSVANALLLNETTFKGRQLKVGSKRTNVPGMKVSRRAAVPAYRPYFPPRGRFRRGGRGSYYHPYS